MIFLSLILRIVKSGCMISLSPTINGHSYLFIGENDRLYNLFPLLRKLTIYIFANNLRIKILNLLNCFRFTFNWFQNIFKIIPVFGLIIDLGACIYRIGICKFLVYLLSFFRCSDRDWYRFYRGCLIWIIFWRFYVSMITKGIQVFTDCNCIVCW